MTYCVGLKLNEGLVLLSDTRTNAGLDNVARFRKMFTWEEPGERAIAMVTAGNLAITQAVMNRLQEAIDTSDAEGTLLSAPTMHKVAQMVGDAMQQVQGKYHQTLEQRNENSAATIMVAGQVKGGQPRLFLVYAAGNYIEATEDTPYLQIGEHKYGKPILDRVVTQDTPLATASRRCCCPWIRPCAPICRWVCRWISRCCRPGNANLASAGASKPKTATFGRCQTLGPRRCATPLVICPTNSPPRKDSLCALRHCCWPYLPPRFWPRATWQALKPLSRPTSTRLCR